MQIFRLFFYGIVSEAKHGNVLQALMCFAGAKMGDFARRPIFFWKSYGGMRNNC